MSPTRRPVKAVFARIVQALGEIDILVNNAGIDTTCEVASMPTEMWDRMIDVHLKGTFLCTREVLPAMKRRKWGRIINLSSQLAHKGGPTMAHYCAAKAGIMGFTQVPGVRGRPRRHHREQHQPRPDQHAAAARPARRTGWR